MSAPQGRCYSEQMCSWQAWYLVFGFVANCWMNAVVVNQLYKMLGYSNRRLHYYPPTQRFVTQQAGAVYLYAAALALFGAWNIQWLPDKVSACSGFACFPLECDLPSTLFFGVIFAPAFMVIPLIYAIWVAVDVLWWRKLLPPRGRRRKLVLYFARLMGVCIIMWLPFLVICTIGNNVQLSSWTFWAGSVWSHLQGIVSVELCAHVPKKIFMKLSIPC